MGRSESYSQFLAREKRYDIARDELFRKLARQDITKEEYEKKAVLLAIKHGCDYHIGYQTKLWAQGKLAEKPERSCL